MRRLALLLLTAFAAGSLYLAAQEDVVAFDLDRVRRATVFIMQVEQPDNEVITCVGSGTLVSRSGLILTNAHHTVPNINCPGQAIIIAIAPSPGEAPIPRFRAEVAQANVGLDLALLRITADLDGRLFETGSLALPFVALGDSTDVRLGETLTAVGFPGIQGEATVFSRGTVSGFVTEPSAPDRAWIKMSGTSIFGTMTGGGVYNRSGELVGIPTTVPVVTVVENVSCLALQDTNQDDLVNSSDRCVPVGGFVNAIRPSNFAEPLVRGGSLGLTVTTPLSQDVTEPPTAAPEFTRLFFSTGVTDGMPSSVVNSLPSGTTSLFLFFDYRGMTPETVYEVRVNTEGRPNPVFSLAPVRWSGGSRGLWYFGNSGQNWEPGLYEFTLFINGLASASARIAIGGNPEAGPSFSDILFGLSAGGNFFSEGYIVPSGDTITAQFIYNNLTEGQPWTQLWYYGDELLSRIDATWTSAESNGAFQIPLQTDSGQNFPPGRYRLELYIDSLLAATADFMVAGAREAAFARIFSDARFVTAETDAEAPTASPSTNFPDAINALYAVFDWELISQEVLWTLRWYVDDRLFYELTLPWDAAPTGENYLVRLTAPGGVPDGTYRMELLITVVGLVSIEAQVGIGQLPVDPFAQTSGIQLNGRITDAQTGDGLPGVTFVLISEEFSVSDFITAWDEDQVYALAITDRSGRFQIDRLLQFDAPYSVYIVAEGFLPVAADGVVVTEETDNPLEIVIPLSRD
jgi:hypothetical protein